MAPTQRSVPRSSSGKDALKKPDESAEVPAYSQEIIQHNMRIIYYRYPGVLGLTGVTGFLCYFVIMLLASAGIAAKAKFDISSYFDSWNRVTLDGIGQGFMSFILFWTFAYDIVHIF